MKFFTFDGAPNPQRLQYFLNYKNIQLDTQQINMGTAEQLGDNFKAVNPKGTLPTLLLDDGNILTDVVAACHYLEALHPDKPAMGSNAYEQAMVLSWDHTIFVEGLKCIGDILRNGNPNFKGRALPGPVNVEQIPELVERGALLLNAFWQQLDMALAGKDYLVGNSVTLADITGIVTVNFSAWVKQQPSEELTHIHRWHKQVSKQLGL